LDLIKSSEKYYKHQKWKKKSNLTFIAILVIPITIVIAFIAIQFIINNTRSPVKTNWSKVETMLTSNDIEKIVVVNNKDAKVYIKPDRLIKYEQEFNTSFTKPAYQGPHFTFNVGAVETFEKNLGEAQKDKTNKIEPVYSQHRNRISEILWTIFPIILVIVILIAYFIPTFIARDKENFRKIAVLNIIAGWTILGWVGALYWAISSNATQTIYTHVCKRCGYKYEINQEVKLFVCPNCRTENKTG